MPTQRTVGAALLWAGAALAQPSGAQSLADLLLNEAVVTPTEGEFIEIVNTGDTTLALSDVYLTDATFAPGGAFYYNIVTGDLDQAGGGGFSDWHARFPAGATIAPGEIQTIALGAGAGGFFGQYGFNPTYEVCDTDGAVADMRDALPGSINCAGNSPGLTNSGEFVVMYAWDGLSDLVEDIDYIVWGDKDEAVDKTGVAIDGPDGDMEASAYQPDTAVTAQAVIAPGAHDFGNSFSRADLTEGSEVDAGGNGVDGDDETSENLGLTFCEAAATPGIDNLCEPPPPPGDLVLIHEIQGAQHRSPLEGEVVSVEAIVTAVGPDGFYIQEEDAEADADVATSEGMFVFTGGAPGVAVGDLVQISDEVEEFRPFENRVTITNFVFPDVTVVSSGNPLPTPVVLGVDRIQPTEIIDNDSEETINIEVEGSFDANEDAIDFYESLEGMLVQANDLFVSGASTVFGSPTPGNAELYTLVNSGANAGPRTENGGIYISPEDFNPENLILNNELTQLPLEADTGDFIPGSVTGVISSNFGKYFLLPTAVPEPVAGNLTQEVTALAGDADTLTVASYNVLNLDPEDGDGDADLGNGRFDAIAATIVNNLRSPDIIGLQEIQDNSGSLDDGTVAADLTGATLIDRIIAAGGPSYEYAEVVPFNLDNGGQPGGNIRTAFLYNPARVQFVARGKAGAGDAVEVLDGPGVPDLSLSPGLIDPSQFVDSRKPTVGEFLFNGQTVFVVSVHFNSKSGDSGLFDILQPPVLFSEEERLVQAGATAAFVSDVLARDPSSYVVVLGDLNDFEFSAPVQVLVDAGLVNLVDGVTAEQRYSFVFNGNSQVLDHVLVSDALAGEAVLDMVHVNVDFAATASRASDHDPLVAALSLPASAVETLRYYGDSLAAGTIEGVGQTPEQRQQRAALYARLIRVLEFRLRSGLEQAACESLGQLTALADGEVPDAVRGEGLEELGLRYVSIAAGAGCP